MCDKHAMMMFRICLCRCQSNVIKINVLNPWLCFIDAYLAYNCYVTWMYHFFKYNSHSWENSFMRIKHQRKYKSNLKCQVFNTCLYHMKFKVVIFSISFYWQTRMLNFMFTLIKDQHINSLCFYLYKCLDLSHITYNNNKY